MGDSCTPTRGRLGTATNARMVEHHQRPAAMTTPCDWDGETHCTICNQPATHQRLHGMAGDTLLVEYVCCKHANTEPMWKAGHV